MGLITSFFFHLISIFYLFFLSEILESIDAEFFLCDVKKPNDIIWYIFIIVFIVDIVGIVLIDTGVVIVVSPSLEGGRTCVAVIWVSIMFLRNFKYQFS